MLTATHDACLQAAQACELQKQYLAAKRRLRTQLDSATQARSMSAAARMWL